MKLEQIDSQEKREEYRLEMVELQRKANVYRKAIDRFDKGHDDAKRAKILGKCFCDDYAWFRIDGFDEDYSPYGIKILEFSEPGADKPVYQIETNCSIWEDDIEKSTLISKEEFLAKITEVLSYITNIGAGQQKQQPKIREKGYYTVCHPYSMSEEAVGYWDGSYWKFDDLPDGEFDDDELQWIEDH